MRGHPLKNRTTELFASADPLIIGRSSNKTHWPRRQRCESPARFRHVVRLARRLGDHPDEVVLAIVALVELRYVTKTTRGVSQEGLDTIGEQVSSSPRMALFPVDKAVARKSTTIDRDLLRDPWDRFIVAAASAFDLPLVTADRLNQNSGLVGAT